MPARTPSNHWFDGSALRAALTPLPEKSESNSTVVEFSIANFTDVWQGISKHYYFWIPVIAPFFGAVLAAWSYHIFIGAHIPDPVQEEVLDEVKQPLKSS
ncbi:hypothetical protein COOONC_25343 [Cooperia oncophora]